MEATEAVPQQVRAVEASMPLSVLEEALVPSSLVADRSFLEVVVLVALALSLVAQQQKGSRQQEMHTSQ